MKKCKWLCAAAVMTLFLFTGCPIEYRLVGPSGTATGTGVGAANLPDPGWYAYYQFIGAPVTVTVTLVNGSITEVTFDAPDDSDFYINAVRTLLIPQIIANNSFDVDAIAGATATSDGVLEGGREALARIFAGDTD